MNRHHRRRGGPVGVEVDVADLWMVVAMAALATLRTVEEEAALARVRAALVAADERGAS